MANIYLKEAITKEEIAFIYRLMQKEEGIREIFNGKIDRIFSSEANFVIKRENLSLGFINLVRELPDHILFLDIGLLKPFRNLGIGTTVCHILEQHFHGAKFIIAETVNTNISAIKSLKESGELIYQMNELNYYLINKNRKQEFLSSPAYLEFIEYCNSTKLNKHQYVELMNQKSISK